MTIRSNARAIAMSCDVDGCRVQFVRRHVDGDQWTPFSLRLMARAVYKWHTAAGDASRSVDSRDQCPNHPPAGVDSPPAGASTAGAPRAGRRGDQAPPERP